MLTYPATGKPRFGTLHVGPIDPKVHRRTISVEEAKVGGARLLVCTLFVIAHLLTKLPPNMLEIAGLLLLTTAVSR